jgi:hypothetical protein
MRKRATKQQVVVSLCVLAAVGGAGYFWWPHVHFRFQLARNEVRIPRIPVAEMKAPGKTTGWVACRIGPISLSLPPQILDKADREVGKGSISFTTPEQQLTVEIPFRLPPKTLADHAQLSADFHMSPMHLIAASYRAGTDDFHWFMSHDDLRRHQMLLSMGAHNFPHSNAITVESRFGGEVEGVLILGERGAAAFQWQTASGKAFGRVVFIQKDRDLDLDWVRDVCQSVACDEGRLGEAEYSRKELREMLEALEDARGGKPRDAGKGEEEN